MNVLWYRQLVKHLASDALPVRDPAQIVLIMAQFLVLVIILIGSFHIRLPLFLHPCFALASWGLLWRLFFTWLTHPWPYSVRSCLIPFSGLSIFLKMVHRRGVSRCGGTSGNRGHSQLVPHNIIPLASASPSSDHGRPFPHISFQTTRFKFHSRLNKPILSANITIIITEEEDKPSSSVHTSPSQSQDDSVLQEDVVGSMFNCDDLQEEGNVPEVPQPPIDTAQHNLPAVEPAHPSDGNLNLVVSPGGGDLGHGDNVVDMWMGSPCWVEKDAPDSLKQA